MPRRARAIPLSITFTGSIIRDPGDGNATACDNADGFRLLTGDEWELAARYITDDGDVESTGDVAWYTNNSDPDNDLTKSTQIVGTAGNFGGATLSGSANGLGLHDMSGNVWEWLSPGEVRSMSLSWSGLPFGFWRAISAVLTSPSGELRFYERFSTSLLN
jgi:hypothetical protein